MTYIAMAIAQSQLATHNARRKETLLLSEHDVVHTAHRNAVAEQFAQVSFGFFLFSSW